MTSPSRSVSRQDGYQQGVDAGQVSGDPVDIGAVVVVGEPSGGELGQPAKKWLVISSGAGSRVNQQGVQ